MRSCKLRSHIAPHWKLARFFLVTVVASEKDVHELMICSVIEKVAIAAG